MNLRELCPLDGQKALEFLQGAIRAESITGNESNFVAYLEPKMDELGLSPKSEEFDVNRLNIWGSTPDGSRGNRLLVMGHTDTVHVDGWSERWKSTERENPFCGAIVEDQIWGRGSGDLKAGICSWLMAWDWLRQNNVELAGGLQFAFVGDEESGEEGMGVSAGVRHYVNKIAKGLKTPDFAVYTEPSQLDIYTAQMGFFIADIAIEGKTAYFGLPEKGVDALKGAHKILEAIFEHSQVVSTQNHHELVGKPFALVTKMSAGGYIAVPGNAKISLIRKVSPLEKIDHAVDDFRRMVEEAAADTGCRIDIRFPAGRDHKFGGLSSVADPDTPEVKLLSECIRQHWSDGGEVRAAPFWSEKSFLKHALGCDAVYCAPGDISNCHTLEERVDLKEYLASIQAFAEFIVRYCGT